MVNRCGGSWREMEHRVYKNGKKKQPTILIGRRKYESTHLWPIRSARGYNTFLALFFVYHEYAVICGCWLACPALAGERDRKASRPKGASTPPTCLIYGQSKYYGHAIFRRCLGFFCCCPWNVACKVRGWVSLEARLSPCCAGIQKMTKLSLYGILFQYFTRYMHMSRRPISSHGGITRLMWKYKNGKLQESYCFLGLKLWSVTELFYFRTKNG